MNTVSDLIPSWNLRGICGEARQLISSKTGEVWNHTIKIIAMGGAFDLSTKDPKVFATIEKGNEYRASGTFEQFNGRTQFIIDTIEAVNAPLASPASKPQAKEAK